MAALLIITALATPLGILGAIMCNAQNKWVSDHALQIVLCLLLIPIFALFVFLEFYEVLA